MRKYWFIVFILNGWLVWASCAQAAEIKIGVVNLQQILTASTQAKQTEVAAGIANKQAALIQQAQSLQAQLKTLEQNYIAITATLVPQEKRDRLAEIAQKERDNRAAIAAAKTEIQSLQAVDVSWAQIQEIVTKYGKENGYTLILEGSADPMGMGGGGILYFDPIIDITTEIQKLLAP